MGLAAAADLVDCAQGRYDGGAVAEWLGATPAQDPDLYRRSDLLAGSRPPRRPTSCTARPTVRCPSTRASGTSTEPVRWATTARSSRSTVRVISGSSTRVTLPSTCGSAWSSSGPRSTREPRRDRVGPDGADRAGCCARRGRSPGQPACRVPAGGRYDLPRRQLPRRPRGVGPRTRGRRRTSPVGRAPHRVLGGQRLVGRTDAGRRPHRSSRRCRARAGRGRRQHEHQRVQGPGRSATDGGAALRAPRRRDDVPDRWLHRDLRRTLDGCHGRRRRPGRGRAPSPTAPRRCCSTTSTTGRAGSTTWPPSPPPATKPARWPSGTSRTASACCRWSSTA